MKARAGMDAKARHNWHRDVFFGIHYDQHANAGDTVLGAELTHDHLRERLQRVQPDWIQCDCKGHPGYTSWPTQVGSASPGVVKDALRIYRDVTRELGIKLGVHYSGVIDQRAVELHPDWACMDVQENPDRGSTCPLSPYTQELMIPHMLEVVRTYDVDGFWVDGENWGSKPCWCERCQTEFARRTGSEEIPHSADDPLWQTWLAFHRDLFVEHVTRYASAIHAEKPECLVCSNWMYSARQPDTVVAPVDYLSGDYSWSWGAERAAVEGRVLAGRGLPWDLMAWGFTKTGDMGSEMPWVMKTATHLCQEVAEVVALGGSIMVYNTPQRTGWLTGWHQDLLGEVAGFCRKRQDLCWQTETVPQAAVLHLADHFYTMNDPLYNFGQGMQPVEGALHALLETHRSTDILTLEAALAHMDEYALVVVPEQTRLSENLVQAIERYAHAGGRVLLSGADLANECPSLVGASPAGMPVEGTSYLAVGERAVGVTGPWQPVQPASGVEIWGVRLTQQELDKDRSEDIVVTCRRLNEGAIVAVHGPVFRRYFQGHYPLLRAFLGDLVERLNVPWRVTVDAPPRLEMVLRHKLGRLIVNLLNRGAGETLSPNRVIVEELPSIEDVVLHIRRQDPPVSLSVVPGDVPITWHYGDGELTVSVPKVDIHTVIAVE